MAAALVLGHQGGWDEVLLILTPIALFAGLLWLANRRADAQLHQRRGEEVDPPEDRGETTTPTSDDDRPTDETRRRGPGPPA